VIFPDRHDCLSSTARDTFLFYRTVRGLPDHEEVEVTVVAYGIAIAIF
jgi:hypothetical protein